MIASVRGEVLDIALDHVVIEACGVGYQVNATPVDAGDAAPRHRGPADHRDDRARGLDDAVRLRRLRRPRPVPDAAVGVRRRAEDRAGHAGRPRRARAAAGAGRRRRHRADPGAGHRQARRRTDGARTARQGRPGRDRQSGCLPSTAMRCAARWWKRLSDLALRSSRPRRPPTRCWPTSRRRPRRARCARRCRCLGKK